MWLPRNSTPSTHSKLSTRLRRSSSAAGILVAASVALTACASTGAGAGSSGSPARSAGSPVSLNTSHSVLNTAKIQLAIENSALAQRGRHVRVTCPTGVKQAKGVVFSCTAYYGHSSTPFAVTELDALGNVHYAAR
jgi:predicted small secreted protein